MTKSSPESHSQFARAEALLVELSLAAEAPPSAADTPSMKQRVARADRILQEWGASARDAQRRRSASDETILWGRFELIEPLGQGGFGIVSLAYDRLLQRHVALKMPTLAQLGSRRHRKQMLEEARLAARLTHPGIVQVHQVGRRGPIIYIVSAFCAGPNLARWMAERTSPLAPRLAVEIVAQLAEAVAYAHGEGLLHRDLKPSNVLIEEPPGREPRVLLTDFGLASRLDAADASEGELRGTLGYLAPEALRGEPVDVRAEVYSLGAILVELLTHATPGAGPRNESASAGQAPRERALPLASLGSDAPLDLRAICGKCLATETEHRYATVAQLADDLRRFLRGDEVVARPLGPVESSWRQCRRRPISALLAAALATSVLVGLASVLWLYQLERDARRRAEAARDTTRQTVDDMYTQVAEKLLTDEPQMEGVRRELLLKALDFYQRDSVERGQDEGSRFAASVALHRAANVEAHFGRLGEATRLRRACLAEIDRLLRDSPRNAEYRYARFHNHLLLSEELSAQGDKRRGGELARAAYSEALELSGADDQSSVYRDAIAASGQAASLHHIEARQWTLAESTLKRSLEAAELLVREHPGHAGYLGHVASIQTHLGGIYETQGDLQAATIAYLSAVTTSAQLQELEPRSAMHRLRDVTASCGLGHVLSQQQRLDDAKSKYERAVRVAEGLVADFPKGAQYRLHCAIAHEQLGGLLRESGDDDAANRSESAAIVHYEVLLQESPDDVGLQRRLAKLRDRG